MWTWSAPTPWEDDQVCQGETSCSQAALPCVHLGIVPCLNNQGLLQESSGFRLGYKSIHTRGVRDVWEPELQDAGLLPAAMTSESLPCICISRFCSASKQGQLLKCRQEDRLRSKIREQVASQALKVGRAQRIRCHRRFPRVPAWVCARSLYSMQQRDS